MTDRSLTVHSHHQVESSRLDHTVLALLVAVTAYGAQTISPQALEWTLNSYNAELLSLVLLLAAIFSAFKRIESVVELLKFNSIYLHALEMRGTAKQIVDRDEPGMNVNSGEVLTPVQAKKEVESRWQEAEAAHKDMAETQESSLAWYKARNRLLLAGMLLLVLSRILLGYEGDEAQQPEVPATKPPYSAPS